MSDDKAPYIHLDTDKFRDLIAGVIFKTMDEKTRNELVEYALKNLIEPQKDRYSVYSSPSQLQSLFDTAVRKLAEEVVQEKFAQDDVREKVRKLMEDTFEKIFSDERVRDQMTTELASAFRYGINNLAGLSATAVKKVKEAMEKENG